MVMASNNLSFRSSNFAITESPGPNVIVNTTRITVPPENRGELFQTIGPLLEPIRNEKGCLAYRFYVDVTDENSTVLIGEWESQEDWANHLQSRDFAVLLGAITILSSPWSIDFKLLSSVSPDEASQQPLSV